MGHRAAQFGAAFVLQRVFNLGFLMRGLVPLMLIGLGIYILRGYVFKPKAPDVGGKLASLDKFRPHTFELR